MSSYSKSNKTPTKESIIGLGEGSIRKNYYPELQETISTLERMRSRNQALMMAIPDILLVSDASSHLTPFSTTSRQEAGLVLSIMRRSTLMEQLKREIQKVLRDLSARSFNFEHSYENALRHFEARLHRTDQNEVLVIIRDMTERIDLENQLRNLAETDYATGLMNRRKFETSLIAYEMGLEPSLSLIVFDIDGLKGINDTLGHLEGDRVIKVVGDVISKIFCDALCIARIGGNEFGVAYINTPQSDIESRCEAFQETIAEYNAEQAYEFTVSFGIADSADQEVSLMRLYQLADYNLYNNKLLKDNSSKSALVRTLMKALEAKDFITEGHAERMTESAKGLGRLLNLEHHRMDQIVLLTKFHDLGKVGIPDKILNKAGPLTPEEWKIMETHTTIGQRIASVSPELKSISDLILMHHEKWDGTGYPLKISGEMIPLECRILSLVDAFDAMTNDRPYRKAMSYKDAVEEIKRCSGTQFDPDLVKLFIDNLHQFISP